MSRATRSTWSVWRADPRFRRFPSAMLSYTTTREAPSARIASTTWDPICPAPPVTRTLLPFSEGMSFRSNKNLRTTCTGQNLVHCARNILDVGFGHLRKQRQAQDPIREPGSIRIILGPISETLLVIRLQMNRNEMDPTTNVLCL